MIRLRERYDWISVGDNVGGLLGACLAARLGLSALVVPLLEQMQAAKSPGGQIWDPESNYVPWVSRASDSATVSSKTSPSPNVNPSINEEHGLLGRCLSEFGLQEDEWKGFLLGKADPWLATPKNRIQFSKDETRLGIELAREFENDPKQISAWKELLAFAEKHAFDHWKNYPENLVLKPKTTDFESYRAPKFNGAFQLKGDLGPKGSSQTLESVGRPALGADFAELGAALWSFVSEEETENPEWNEFLHSLVHARFGSVYRGGMSALRTQLMQIARRLGVHIPEGTQCRRIFIENGKFVGIQAAQVGQMIGARSGSIMTPLSRVRELIQFSGDHRSHSVALDQPDAVAGWRFGIALTVKKHALPEAFGNRLIWKERGAPSLEFELADPLDYNITEPDHRLLFVRTTLQANAKTLDPAYQRVVASQMMRQACELFPFLDSNWVRIFPDFRAHSDDFKLLYGFESVDQIPENLRRYQGKGVGSRSGIEGLFVVSSESFPKLGMGGQIIAAVEGVTWLSQRSGFAHGLSDRSSVNTAVNLGATT